MARQRKEPKAKDVPLSHPDRSGPKGPTLLDIAQEKNLFAQATARERALKAEKQASGDEIDGQTLSPQAERVLETLLWTLTLALLHLTFDVLVQHQYGTEVEWSSVSLRTARAWIASVVAGCYLIHISNEFGYLAVMKQAPPLGCIWVWSVIELDLPWAVLSLAVAGGYLWYGGYSVY
ncbi:uncharacterized protein J7T54_007874 [Emericellopsis cladophorae]|uniref:DUF7719 domain-containing protein n=1 Tax=Emericellopsis cladophorae TaxID=2686198 RepID=A0A9P9Y787_9HYPO|nr:uncharacterized protein J7T54_007874 [Emericellopsis cladophorae]KAI6784781.1 hypothetical protein J7T54_007874 [Emericellopsis cladophorae]